MSDNKEKEIKINEPESVEEESKEQDSADEQEKEAESVDDVPQAEELSEEEKLKQRVTELEDRILRNSAEFENYKKRTARQYEDMVRFSNEKTIAEILDIIDNFDRALAHKDESSDVESFAQGIGLINNQMHALLEKYNVTAIDALGKPFDPNFHEAMMQVESDEFEAGHVTFEMNKGYMIGERVLRHSKVGVAKAKEVVEEQNEEKETEE